MIARISTELVAFVDLDCPSDIEKTSLAVRKAMADWAKRLELRYWTIDSNINNDDYISSRWESLVKKEKENDSNRD